MSDIGVLVGELEAVLRCPGCGQIGDESLSSSVCPHTLCRSCVESVFTEARSQCPACSIPLWRHNLRSNPLLVNIGKYAAELAQQIPRTDSGSDTEAETVGDPDERLIVGPSENEYLPASPPLMGADRERLSSPFETRQQQKLSPLISSREAMSSPLMAARKDLSPLMPSRPLAPSDDEETSPSWPSMDALKERHQQLVRSYTELNLSAILSSLDSDRLVASQPAPTVIVFQTSGLTQQRKDVHDALLAMGASLGDDIQDCTHLIVGVDERNRCQRTLKYAIARVRGIWIVSEEWVQESTEKGQWADELDFEVVGDIAALNVINAQQRTRFGPIRVFAGCDLAIDEGSELPDLVPLIRLGGGNLVEPGLDKSGKVLLICEHELSMRRAKQLAKHYGVVPVSVAWVFDCCSHLEQIPFQPYRLDIEKTSSQSNASSSSLKMAD